MRKICLQTLGLDNEPLDEKVSLQDGLSSRRVVREHEKQIRFSEKINRNERNDNDRSE
jgi:hypothetical protein